MESEARVLRTLEPRLNRAFVARFGWPDGLDVTAEVMAWAWANANQLAEMHNPAGYLYRVGTTRARRFIRWKREVGQMPADIAATETSGWFEPQLPAALNHLDRDSRTAVVLVHCFEWTYPEVAEMLDVPLHTVRNRVHRGMKALRRELGVQDD